jgi:DNA topoisomerase-2
MIFGHLLTSSNYDDDEQKTTGGRNGYGAKLCNIFSTKFILETQDSKNKKSYKQVWNNNMSNMGEAKITTAKGDDYTRITFYPDWKKFGMSGVDDDFEALVKRRVYDMAGTSKGVKVYLNKQRVKVTNFKKYMEMFTKALKAETSAAASGDAQTDYSTVILTDNPNERWEVGFAVSDGSFQQVSFVNSIATTSGGTHVNYVADQIVTKLADIVKKKNKGGLALKPNQIKNHIFLFVNCLITNPAFTSQTKEQLTTKPTLFGSKCPLSEKFLKDIAKTDAVNNIIHFAQQKADQVLKKSDGGKRTRMNNSKLTDANKAGTRDGRHCTLILTEGDSASLLALAGRAVVSPDLIGVFPLRGKLLNVRDASIDQISKNAEIQNIKKFIGLQHKKVYTSTADLRYGHLMIMTDQDHDGSHIKGLLINFLEVQFPSLLKIDGFLQEFITPIVKVWKGDPKHPKQLQSFFTMPEYEAWKQLAGHDRGWDHKYFKGLGTSRPEDAQEYFRDLDKHLKQFATIKQEEPELIDLAFSKKKADQRKEWLRQFRPGTYLDMTTEEISYTDFINKELILFSMADNQRSIPSVVDGFKPGQRKVLYTCLRRNLKKDVKVVELAGSVSGLTAYAYGETSLQQTIVGLAQTFVGSNNINCLEPSGNFGSRLQGGSDAASARYIYTRLSPFARKIFMASDEALLTYNTDDGKTIEPEVYVPVVPMILINGADGIGTGWSSSIPNYDPREIVENIRRRMDGDKSSMLPMMPWFRSWTGMTEDIGSDRYKFNGTIEQTGDNEVQITELPIRVWTQDFKDKLEEIIKAEKTPSFIKDYSEYNTPDKVHFIIKLEDKHMAAALEKTLEETFKLSKTMATSNLVAFDPQGRIQKYATVLDIMEEFYHVRLDFYRKRKMHLLREIERELDKFNNQAKFIRMIVDGKLIVSKKKKLVLVQELRAKGFKAIPKIADARKEGEFEAVVDDDASPEEAAENKESGASDYDYLLGMAIWSLTEERIEKLNKQIGDLDAQHIKLTKTSEKDLWRTDLDDFLAEWEFQLEDEKKRADKEAKRGRRASTKLKIGVKGGNRKRKDDSDDDDFDLATKKTSKVVKAATKPPIKAEPKKQTGLVDWFDQDKSKSAPLVNGIEQKPVARAPAAADFSDEDVKPIVRASSKQPSAPPAARAAKKSRTIKEDSDDFDDDDFAAIAREAKTTTAAGRPGRAAAAKKPIVLDESIMSSEDDFDVSNMVKGISSAAAPTVKPLFTETSGRASSVAASSKLKASRPVLDEDTDVDMVDGTNFEGLIRQDSPAKPAPKSARDIAITDDDDSLLSMAPARTALIKTSKAVAKPAAKPAAAAKSKVKPMSPAAKAYAKKYVAEKPKTIISDDEETKRLADDILTSDVEDDNFISNKQARPVPPPATKSRAAPKAKASVQVPAKGRGRRLISDDEDDEIELMGESEVAAARPSRRAAVTSKKPSYMDDDDDDSEEVGEEESEEDYDEDDE